MVNVIKLLIKALGLKSFILYIMNKWCDMRPDQIVKRDGIVYALDCRELIDRSIYIQRSWEPETVAFINKNVKENDVVIEVGANIGAHTLILAKKVGKGGKVFAFEPTSFARNKLLKNISLNPDLQDRIVVRDNLVTDGSHQTPTLNLRSSWAIHKEHQQKTEESTSSLITIDEFLENEGIEKVDVLKIDVDGYDYKVLGGAKNTIQQHMPLIFIELCEYTLNRNGDSIRDIYDLLSSQLNYSVSSDKGIPIPTANEVIEIVGEKTSINGVFVQAGGL